MEINKLFKQYKTYDLFKKEKVHPINKLCFIKDKGIIYCNDEVYSTANKDIITSVTGETIEILSPVILLDIPIKNNTNISKFDNSFTGIERFTLIQNNDTPNVIKFNNDISSIKNISEINLTKGTSITFIKKDNKWNIEYGVSNDSLYIPSVMPETDNSVFTISNVGIVSMKKYTNIKTWSETEALLSADLLQIKYPDAPKGFQVVCPKICKIYEKINEPTEADEWISTDIHILKLGEGVG